VTTEPRRHWDSPLFPYFVVDLDNGVFGFLEEILEAKLAHSRGRYGDAYDDMLERGVKAFRLAREGRTAEIEAAIAPKRVIKRKPLAKAPKKR